LSCLYTRSTRYVDSNQSLCNGLMKVDQTCWRSDWNKIRHFCEVAPKSRGCFDFNKIFDCPATTCSNMSLYVTFIYVESLCNEIQDTHRFPFSKICSRSRAMDLDHIRVSLSPPAQWPHKTDVTLTSRDLKEQERCCAMFLASRHCENTRTERAVTSFKDSVLCTTCPPVEGRRLYSGTLFSINGNLETKNLHPRKLFW